MKNKAMIINRETAMSLWNKSFGKTSKVEDFAGRTMVKAAYNDRNSDYGWNIDHILPQSKGGKTTESNLICCHILTNDEKADKFPCFSANGKRFEIIKVENHYEIKEVNNKSNDNNKPTDNEINFYDPASGLRFYKSLKGIQNKPIFVGTVIIELNNIRNTAIIDFIDEIFSDTSISYKQDGDKTIITLINHNMPQKEDTADLLDRCVLINTYLSYYFAPLKIIENFKIFYGMHNLDDKLTTLTSENFFRQNYNYYNCFTNIQYGALNNTTDTNTIVINELVKNNANLNQKIDNSDYIGEDKLGYKVYRYNYIFTKLSENLKKLI